MTRSTIKTWAVDGTIGLCLAYVRCLTITFPILGLVTVWTTSCVHKSDHKNDSSSVLRLWKASHGETRQDFEHLVAPFLERHPNLHIEALAHPWEGWDERYAIAYTGGIPPDIAYMPDEFWPRFAAAGKLLALDEQFPQEIEVMAREYPDNLWQLGSMGGHQYGIPYIYTSWHLYYNPQLFDETGLQHPPATPNSPGFDEWNWESFYQAGKKLTKDTNGDGTTDQWGLAWGVLDVNPNTMYPFVWQGGADLLTKDGQKNALSEHGTIGFHFMKKLAADGITPEGGLHPNPSTLFFEGRAGMLIAPAPLIPILKRDFPNLPFGTAIVPQGPATNFWEGRGTFGNSGFWVMSASTQHPRKAFQLLCFITALEQAQKMMQITRLFSARLDWQGPKDDPRLKTFVVGRRFLVPYPLHPRLRLIHTSIMAEVQAMILDHKSPDQAVADAAESIDALIALR